MSNLAAQMKARADSDGLPADHKLRADADAFDGALAGYIGNPQTVDARKFLGCWARARKTWCQYTGEPLI